MTTMTASPVDTFTLLTIGTKEASSFLRRVMREAQTIGRRREWSGHGCARRGDEKPFVEFRCDIRADRAGDVDMVVRVRLEAADGERPLVVADGNVDTAFMGWNGAWKWAKVLSDGATLRIGRSGSSTTAKGFGVSVRILSAEWDGMGSKVELGHEVYVNGRVVMSGPFPCSTVADPERE